MPVPGAKASPRQGIQPLDVQHSSRRITALFSLCRHHFFPGIVVYVILHPNHPGKLAEKLSSQALPHPYDTNLHFYNCTDDLGK